MGPLRLLLDENETPFQQLGQAVEWRKPDGFFLDQGRDRRGTEGRKDPAGGTENSQTLENKARLCQSRPVSNKLPPSETQNIVLSSIITSKQLAGSGRQFILCKMCLQ